MQPHSGQNQGVLAPFRSRLATRQVTLNPPTAAGTAAAARLLILGRRRRRRRHPSRRFHVCPSAVAVNCIAGSLRSPLSSTERRENHRLVVRKLLGYSMETGPSVHINHRSPIIPLAHYLSLQEGQFTIFGMWEKTELPEETQAVIRKQGIKPSTSLWKKWQV